MAEEIAFFQFRNNADQTAADIAAAMQRINQSLSKPLSDHALSLNIGGLGQTFARTEAELAAGKERINKLLRQLGTGTISRGDFDQRVRQEIQGTVGKIPTIMADAMAQAPEAVAMRTPAVQLAGQFATEFRKSLVNELRSNRGLAGGALKGAQFRLSDIDLSQFTTRPVAYGDETSALNNLINRVRAENLVRQDPTGITGRPTAKATGMEALFDQIRKDSVVEVGEEGRKVFIDPGTKAELADVVRRTNEARAAGDRLNTTKEKQLELDRQLAIAERLVADGAQQAGSRIIDPKTGAPYRTTTTGATEETNPLRIAQAQAAAETAAQKRTNSARLAAAGPGEVFRLSPTLVEMEGIYYRLTKLGAERVHDEALIKTYQQQQAEALERQAVRANRLNEFDGKRLLAAERGQSGLLGGFVGRFQRGGQSLATGLGGQIASAAAFSFAYGSLFALQGAMRDTAKEFLDYQDSFTDLQVATRNADIVNPEWINDLSELSRLSGANVGAAIDATARGVRAFSTSDSSPEDTRAAGSETARAAARLALIANKPLTDATGDIVASGSAFGLRPDQLEQVVDAVSNAKRTVGGDASQISQGLSLIALAAQEAGFNLNEAAAVIGLVQARTDQSGQAIATRLTRIFQIVQGSTGRRLASELSDYDPTKRQVLSDPAASVKDRIETFAKIYSNPDTSEAVRNRIASGLGGTANLRELLPLLKENSALQDAYKEALDNAGQGTDEFNRKTGNLVGTLLKIKGDISNLQVGLGKSGLFDIFGAGIKIIEPALYGLERLINAYEELTGNNPALQTMVGLVLDLLIASKAIGALQLAGGIFGIGAGAAAGTSRFKGAAAAAIDSAGGVHALAARDREAAGILQAAQQRLAAEGRYDQVILLAAGDRAVAERELAAAAALGAAPGRRFDATRTGASAIGGVLSSGTFLAIAGITTLLVAYGKQKQYDEQEAGARATAAKSSKAFESLDGSSAGYRSAAQDLNAIAGELRKSDVPGRYEDTRDSLAEAAQGRSSTLLWLSRRKAAEENYAASLNTSTKFGSRAIETVQQLADGFEEITANGGTALTAYRALSDALRTPPPEEGTSVYSAAGLRTDIVASLLETAAASVPKGTQLLPNGAAPRIDPTAPVVLPNGQTLDPRTSAAGALSAGYAALGQQGDYPAVTDPQEILAQLGLTGKDSKETAKKINAALKAEMDRLKINPQKGITDEQRAQLVQVALETVDLSKLSDDGKAIVAEWTKNTIAALQDKAGQRTVKGAPATLFNSDKLSRSQVNQLLNPGEAGPDGQAPYQGLVAYQQSALGAIPKSDDGTLLEAQLQANLHDLRLVARKARRGSDGGRGVTQQLELELRNAESAYRETAVANAEDLRLAAESRATSTRQLQAIRLQFAKISFGKAGSNKNIIEDLMESMDRKTVKAVIEYTEIARDTVRAALRHAQAVIRASIAVMRTTDLAGGAASWRGAPGASQGMYDQADGYQKQLDRYNKQLDALNDVFTNNATIDDKSATLPKEAGKSPEDLAAERRAKAEERLNNAIDALQLTGDFTDPVEQARDALRAAQMRYKFERTPGNKAEVLQSEASLEKAKWDQKLSDMQTAEQLGRISYSTYVRYLQSESDRMHKMQHKTRQQIDYMNQIDLALKETTASMEGQFNLGDIDTKGFVYAVRRMMGGDSATGGAKQPWGGWQSAAYQQIYNNQQIHFSGIDERTLRKVLADIMGGVPVHTTTSRKVT